MATLDRDTAITHLNASGIFAFIRAKKGDVPGVILFVDSKFRGSCRVLPHGQVNVAGLRRMNSVAAQNVKNELTALGFELVD